MNRVVNRSLFQFTLAKLPETDILAVLDLVGKSERRELFSDDLDELARSQKFANAQDLQKLVELLDKYDAFATGLEPRLRSFFDFGSKVRVLSWLNQRVAQEPVIYPVRLLTSLETAFRQHVKRLPVEEVTRWDVRYELGRAQEWYTAMIIARALFLADPRQFVVGLIDVSDGRLLRALTSLPDVAQWFGSSEVGKNIRLSFIKVSFFSGLIYAGTYEDLDRIRLAEIAKIVREQDEDQLRTRFKSGLLSMVSAKQLTSVKDKGIKYLGPEFEAVKVLVGDFQMQEAQERLVDLLETADPVTFRSICRVIAVNILGRPQAEVEKAIGIWGWPQAEVEKGFEIDKVFAPTAEGRSYCQDAADEYKRFSTGRFYNSF